jgi:hypothetical protein
MEEVNQSNYLHKDGGRILIFISIAKVEELEEVHNFKKLN